MRGRSFQLPSYFKSIGEVGKQLDKTNLKILSAMWEAGPRNLLEVSRRTKLPFTTVYHRVSKLEAKSGRVVYLLPTTAKLGLVRVVVMATAKAGSENAVNEALKLPNMWRIINRCEGPFTHLSAHAVPLRYLKDFKRYVGKLVETGLVSQPRLILTGDSVPNFPNPDYYDSHRKEWKFPWREWLASLKRAKIRARVEDPKEYPILADKKDLLIIKELEKNARKSFVDLASLLGISLQAVKYRYDKRLRPSGILQHFAFDVYPYPVELCAYHEVMLEFSSNQAMNRFFSILGGLLFVLAVAKVLRRNTLLVRTYIPSSQLPNMFAFFSEMANIGILTSYSSVRLDFAGRETQTISYELFDDEKGWTFDIHQCLHKLANLATKKPLVHPRRTT